MSNRAAYDEAEGRPRVVYVGMRCAFSVPPLRALIAAGMAPAAVVLPEPNGESDWLPIPAALPAGMRTLPTVGAASTVESVAREAGIPVFGVRDVRASDAREGIAGMRPDVIAVACFPWRIPASVRALARLGCLNVHPSLLPRWRGPEPLLWTFLAGDRETGVTVHLMDGGYDTGPILRQARRPVLHGVDGSDLEQDLAEMGGRLLVEAIAALEAGEPPVPQDEAKATAAPTPTDVDLALSTDQPLRRLVDVVNGVAPLWGPLTVRVAATEQAFSVVEAVEVGPQEPVDVPVFVTEDVVIARCVDGVAAFRRAGANVRPLTLRGAV